MAGTFSADLSAFADKFDADIKVVVRKFAFEAFKRVILRTPVDTGRARANWGVTVGKPGSAVTDNVDKSGSAAIASAAAGTQNFSCQGSIFLTNSLPYIGVLEYGRDDGTPGSKQAPQGMVRITAEEMSGYIKDTLK